MSFPGALDLSSSAALEAASVEGRRRRARSLAVFFASGGTVSLLVLLAATFGDLPAWAEVDRAGIAVTVALAATAAVLLATAAERVGALACHLFAAAGSVLIAACQALAGGGMATSVYALLYVFVVLHAALFFTARAIVGQVLVSAVAQVAALIWVGEAAAIAPQLILTAGTQLVSGLVISALAVNLRVRADTDPLTGLGNRRRAYTRLVRELEFSRHDVARSTCVAVIDLDDFAAYNDARGEVAGDVVLADLSQFWRGVLREEDVLTRTGGDEFTLVLADCEVEVATAVVRRLLDLPFPDLVCSAGVAAWDGRESAGELILRAYRALDRAKEQDGPLVVSGGAEVGTPA